MLTRSKAKSTLDADGNDNNNSHTPNTTHSTSEETKNNSHNQNTNSKEAKNNSHNPNTPHSKSEEAKNNNHSKSKEATNNRNHPNHIHSNSKDDTQKHNITQSQSPLKLKKKEIPSYQFFDNEAMHSGIDTALGTLNNASSSSSYTSDSLPSLQKSSIVKDLFADEEESDTEDNQQEDNTTYPNANHHKGGTNKPDHQDPHSHHNKDSSRIQHHTGNAGSTKSQTGNAGKLKNSLHDVAPEKSPFVRSKMDNMHSAPLGSRGLQSTSSAPKRKLSSSSNSTNSKNRIWYCDGTCSSDNGRAQPFKNFQSYVTHLRTMHHLASSLAIASAINTCQHNRLSNNPQVFGCPHHACNQVCIGYHGIKSHWGLSHPDDRFRLTSDEFKTTYSSGHNDRDESSTLSEVTFPSLHYPSYTNGLEVLEETPQADKTADTDDQDEEEDEEEEEIYGKPTKKQKLEKEAEDDMAKEKEAGEIDNLPSYHDDGDFEVSDDEPDDDVIQPILTVDQVAEGTVVEPSSTTTIDYFEANSEEGTIVFPALQVGVLLGQARIVIDEFLALSEAERLEQICGVSHLRTNDVDWKHKDVYRSITKRLMRASLGNSLAFYINCIRRGEIVHDDAIPTAVEVDAHDVEIDSRPPLTEDERAITATVAFHVLPTVYRMLKTSKRSIHGNPRSFLEGLHAIDNIDQLIGSLIFLFNKGRAKLVTSHTNNLTSPSDATITRKTKKLVLEDGHVSRGMNYLCRHAEKDNTVTPPPQLSTEEFHQKVITLHPKRNPEHDNLDLVSECPSDLNLDTLKLKATTLNTTLRRLKRDGAPGFDGWTFQLIRQLFEQDMASINDDEPSEDAVLLIAFITHALAGRMPFPSLWNTSRMVLLTEWQPQKNNWKHRPLAIGTAWYRFIGKAALAMLGDSVGRKLAPCQLAVGISDGISIGAKLLQHLRNVPENAILSLDISNAFNSLRRNRILEGLCQYAPSLIPFYKWSYSTPTQVRSGDGSLCCNAETGTRQGDPLSMLFFSVGIHKRILQLSERIQSLNPENLIKAYADDMSLCLPRRQLKDAWDIVADVFPIGLPGDITHDPNNLFETIGIAINPNKCVAITGSLTPPVQTCLPLEPADPTEDNNDQIEEETLPTGQDGVVIPIRRSAKIFGVMIGTREDRLSFVKNLHDQIRKKASYIKRFCGAKVGFLLIKYCLNTIATYVHRIEHPIGLDLGGHDEIISDAIAFYVDQNRLGTTQEIIRGLPHSLGGLGILRHDSFQTTINHDELHIRTLSWLEHQGPSPVIVEGIPTANDAVQPPPTHPGLHKLHQTFPPLKNEPAYLATIGFHNGQRETLSASTRKLNAHKENVEKLKKRLTDDSNTMGDAIWLDGSGFHGSGELYNIGTFYTRFFTDRTFAAALGARLLINDTLPPNELKNVRVYCPHCNMMDLPFPPTAMKYHYLGCRALRRSTVGRHDRIVKHLSQFLSRVFKDTAHVQCEQYTHQPDIDQRRDDITITFHTGEVSMKLGFDIGVTTPVQSTLLERSLKSNQAVDSLIAATNMFEEKTHKYRNSDYDVYPIIFLATGRPSHHMKKMLAALEPHIAVGKTEFHAHWRRFLRDTMCTCTQFIAKAYRNRPPLVPNIHRNPRLLANIRKLHHTRLRLTRQRKFTSSSTDVRKSTPSSTGLRKLPPLLRNTIPTPRHHNNHTRNTPTPPSPHINDDDSVLHLNSSPLADDDQSWTSGNPFNKPKDRDRFR